MVFIITSAFRSSWESNLFSPAHTAEDRFYVGPGDHFPVQMMRTTMHLAYSADEIVHSVVVNYTFKPFALMIVMPRAAANSGTFTRQVTHERFNALLDKAHPTLVRFWLPKVDLVSTTNFIPLMESLGVPSATQPGRANFMGINDGRPEPLYLSVLKQNVMVSWDETGTIARSVTSIGMDPFGGPPPPPPVIVPFIVNRPFQFFIFDRDTRDIYFAGLVRERSQLTPQDR